MKLKYKSISGDSVLEIIITKYIQKLQKDVLLEVSTKFTLFFYLC